MKTKALVLLSVIALIMSSLVGLSSAQEVTDEAPIVDEAPFRDGRHFRFLNGLQDIAEILTEATGLSADEILQQVRDGSTLSEIITANGGDVEAVKAEVSSFITERIETAVSEERISRERADEILANLPEHITRIFDETHEGRMGLGLGSEQGIIAILIGLVSDSTGLSALEIAQEVRDGSSLAEIIAANGGDVETIVNGAMEIITEEVNERVASGDISQEQADTILANSESRITAWLNGETNFLHPNRPNSGNRPNGRPNGAGNGGNGGNPQGNGN